MARLLVLSQNSLPRCCGSGESDLTISGTEGIPRSDLTCGTEGIPRSDLTCGGGGGGGELQVILRTTQ